MTPHLQLIPTLFVSFLFTVVSPMTLTFAQEIPGRELPGPPIQELNLGSNVMKAKLWKGVVDKIEEAIDAEEFELDLQTHIESQPPRPNLNLDKEEKEKLEKILMNLAEEIGKAGEEKESEEVGETKEEIKEKNVNKALRYIKKLFKTFQTNPAALTQKEQGDLMKISSIALRPMKLEDLKNDLKFLTQLQLKIMTAKMTIPVKRGQHPKDHACVAATFQASKDLPSEYRFGVFNSEKPYNSVIRFSNARSANDTATNVQGMAIKLFGVKGTKILKNEDDAETQDFLLADDSSFFAKDARSMLGLMSMRVEEVKGNQQPFNHPEIPRVIQQVLQGGIEIVDDWATSKLKGPTAEGPQAKTYWSQTPYYLGKVPDKEKGEEDKRIFVKYLVQPLPVEGENYSPYPIKENFMRHALLDHLTKKDSKGAKFKFFIQPFKNDEVTPKNDPTQIWVESKTEPRQPRKSIHIATITIHPQNFDSLNHRKFCENLSFTPWHSLPEHQPYGEINLARKFVYLASSMFRHVANGTPRHEPTGRELRALESIIENVQPSDPYNVPPQIIDHKQQHHECVPIRAFEPYKGKEVVSIDQDIPLAKLKEIYHLSQGTEIIPYSWFLHLEQPLREELFRSEDNLCIYKVIPDQDHPDQLPVGFTRTKDKGHPIVENWLGFTCAACHTGQIEFGNKKILINGGQSMWDIKNFVKHLLQALFLTLKDERKLSRFVEKVFETEKGFMEKEVAPMEKEVAPMTKEVALLEKEVARLEGSLEKKGVGSLEIKKDKKVVKLYGEIAELNRKITPLQSKIEIIKHKFYDRFGEDLKKNRPTITTNLRTQISTILGQRFLDKLDNDKKKVFPLAWGFGRLDALGRGPNTVLRRFSASNIRQADAPASYPKLWDSSRYKWVQWTAAITQPLSRNIAQAIGVGARLTPVLLNNDTNEQVPLPEDCMNGKRHWPTSEGEIDKEKCTVQIDTSINWKNLVELEEGFLRKVQPPPWPSQIFGPINETLRAKGKKLYAKYCTSCHLPKPLVESRKLGKSLKINEGLKKKLAVLIEEILQNKELNPTDKETLGGFLDLKTANNQQEDLLEQIERLADKDLMNLKEAAIKMKFNFNKEDFALQEIPISEIGTDVTYAYNFFARRVDLPIFGMKNVPASFAIQELTNRIDKTICPPPTDSNQVDSNQVDPNSMCPKGDSKNPPIEGAIEKDASPRLGRDNIWRAPLAYMAGTNVGIWATAPYLHNGSIPNLYQLLSPREERDRKFCVGNLTFDPKHVGYVTSKPPCAPFHEFEFDTDKIGNSNAGHEFRGDGKLGNGVIGPKLTHVERLAIIEYLKDMPKIDYLLGKTDKPS